MDEEAKTESKKTAYHVVGIGASAGGLEALSNFVANLPQGTHCSYIIAQHMSPNHRSMMVDILSRETVSPVEEAKDGEKPKPGTIYVIPPGYNLSLRHGTFKLHTPSPEISPKPSINLLFQSLAEELDERAIGIVLSGTGSDGTSGLRAIKAVGGITYAQMPETAKYDGMPRSAIDAGVVDHIMPPDQMGQDLERVINFPSVAANIVETQDQPAELDSLFRKVRQQTKIDFSSYKLATVLRRLERRLLATETETLTAYLQYVDEHPQELEKLAKETLISVTEFFRDREAFHILDRHIKELVERKKTHEEIRVWVVGCATGEEAYSLAMLFAENLGSELSKTRLQIFATDIDNNALSFARRGIYKAAAMAEIPQEYISKYFRASGNSFEPIKELRDCVVFARQDIVCDPPFLRTDLISCRNVLIYFNAELQNKVLTTLHYALKPGGLLFLGRSENINQQEALFTTLDRRARIFQRRGEGRPLDLARSSRRGVLPITLPPKKVASSYERLFLEAISKHYAPSAVLIDSEFKIVFMHGNVDQFISLPCGTPEMNLAQLIIAEFRNEILTSLHRARRRTATTYSRKRRIASLDYQTWRLAVHPLKEYREAELFLVAFEPTLKNEASAIGAQENNANTIAEAAANDELQITREHLQTLLEEMAASNEEMQALNEEVQAANEELQATNEELEAANQELQATNEELISVNEESLAKSAEVAAINSEFESLYNTMDFPIMVFDSNLFLKRANLAASRLYDVPAIGNNRHINHLELPPYLQDVEGRLLKALHSQRKETFSANHQDHFYQIFVTPTLNPLGVTQSVVLIVIDNTDLVVANQKIVESQERLLSIMNHSSSIVSLKDAAGCYEFVNFRFEEMFDVKSQDILGKTDYQIFPPELAKTLRRHDLEALDKLTLLSATEDLRLGAHHVILEAVHFPIFDNKGVVRSICMQAIDVTQKHQAEEQLRLAAKVFDRAGEAIMITDAAGTIITVNDAFTTITGYPAEQVVGQKPTILKSGHHDKEFYEQMWQNILHEGWWQGEIINRRADGNVYPEWLTISTVHNASGDLVNYVAIFSDISAVKASQNRIEHLATHDELTNLPNRTLLMDRMKHAIAQAKRKQESLAIMFIDLDNFKNVNDALGHDAGDLLLKLATERLLSCMRDTDTLARMGGDEFVAILNNVEITEVNRIASRVIDFLSASFRISERDCFISASIGISLYPQDGEDSVTLLKNADTAMYRAKDQGRNQFQYFADEMKLKALQRLTIETGLRMALESNRLSLHYQPKMDLHTGQIVGAEALLRWSDPNLGNVSPAQFIPVAENCGLITALGKQVIRMAVQQINTWQQQGLNVPAIAINLSGHQLRDSRFAETLLSELRQAQVEPRALVLELTESMLIERIDMTATLLEKLVALGFKISIDDFGTGYSSLSYLKRLPLHELKIDRSFIGDIETNADDRTIAHTIVNMAHTLGLSVVAEGVENIAQERVLQSINCDGAQGYYYYRPLTAEQFALLLAKRSLP